LRCLVERALCTNGCDGKNVDVTIKTSVLSAIMKMSAWGCGDQNTSLKCGDATVGTSA
jgi:hypothetical protein